jgi:hypothetical protein
MSLLLIGIYVLIDNKLQLVCEHLVRLPMHSRLILYVLLLGQLFNVVQHIPLYPDFLINQLPQLDQLKQGYIF